MGSHSRGYAAAHAQRGGAWRGFRRGRRVCDAVLIMRGGTAADPRHRVLSSPTSIPPSSALSSDAASDGWGQCRNRAVSGVDAGACYLCRVGIGIIPSGLRGFVQSEGGGVRDLTPNTCNAASIGHFSVECRSVLSVAVCKSRSAESAVPRPGLLPLLSRMFVAYTS